MKISLHSLEEGARAARGTVVIIDVFRAFTCMPLLYSLGVVKSVLVATAEEALAIKKRDPSRILVGEIDGIPIKEFDVGNSPGDILRLGEEYFSGKSIVQRTSSGVQGVLIAMDAADEVLLGSYSVARATVDYIKSTSPERVSIVAMGWNLREKAPEDEWCARYMAHLLGQGDYDHNRAMKDILFHHGAQKFLRGGKSYFPPEDPVLALQRDVYDFALKARRINNEVEAVKIAAD